MVKMKILSAQLATSVPYFDLSSHIHVLFLYSAFRSTEHKLKLVLPSTDYKVRHDIKSGCGVGDHNADTARADILDVVANTGNTGKDSVS
jgi:hypothetical protein